MSIITHQSISPSTTGRHTTTTNNNTNNRDKDRRQKTEDDGDGWNGKIDECLVKEEHIHSILFHTWEMREERMLVTRRTYYYSYRREQSQRRRRRRRRHQQQSLQHQHQHQGQPKERSSCLSFVTIRFFLFNIACILSSFETIMITKSMLSSSFHLVVRNRSNSCITISSRSANMVAFVNVDAFRPDSVRNVVRRRSSSSSSSLCSIIRQGYISQYNNCHYYQTLQRQKQKKQKKQRWSRSSFSSANINPAISDEDPESSSSQTKRLPRIYVGGPPTTTPVAEAVVSASALETTFPNTKIANGNGSSSSSSRSSTVRLAASSIVPLTVDQSHYLHVMRIQSVKRWGDQAGYVRIFNGLDGEWLARVVLNYDGAGGNTDSNNNISDENFEASSNSRGGDNDNSNNKKKRKKKPERRKRRSGGNIDDEDGTVLECVQQLLAQDHELEQRQQQQQQQQQQQDRDDDSDDSLDNYAGDDRIEFGKSISVQLYLGLLKKQQLRWVVEKATELGVDGITILDTDFTGHQNTKGGGEWEYDKHTMHIIEAAEQCERLSIPNLSTTTVSLDDLVSYIRGDAVSLSEDYHQQVENGQEHQQHQKTQHLWLVCRERSPDSSPIISSLQQTCTNNLIIHVLVGPEGGWSPKEIEVFSHLTRTISNIQFVSLGSLVLRAETAAITAVAAAKLI